MQLVTAVAVGVGSIGRADTSVWNDLIGLTHHTHVDVVPPQLVLEPSVVLELVEFRSPDIDARLVRLRPRDLAGPLALQHTNISE